MQRHSAASPFIAGVLPPDNRRAAILRFPIHGSHGIILPYEAGRHGLLLKRMHIDADSFRRVIGTLVETETIAVSEGQKNSLAYTLIE